MTRSRQWMWLGAALLVIGAVVVVALRRDGGREPEEQAAAPETQSEDASAAVGDPPAGFSGIEETVTIPGPSRTTIDLREGETLEVACGILRPSGLPPNARVRIRWRLLETDTPLLAADTAREAAEEIGPPPTADWSKLLHALDPDVYVIYRAPVSGTYELSVEPAEDRVTLFQGERWREAGRIAELVTIPETVPWPQDAEVDVRIAAQPIDLTGPADLGLVVEAEPNDSPELAMPIPLRDTAEDYTLHVFGTSDDIEYFDNGAVGAGGDDWYRLEFTGPEPRMLTACLSIPDQQVAAHIRCYELTPAEAEVAAGELLPLKREYTGGKNPNERPHQQTEPHRIAMARDLEPGHIYLLRVEANAPGYELELRIVKPPPFDDPRAAIRHALYDHIGQVDAWLMNRPRTASVERRIRDSGNLLGSGCMSCHTQAGVWGPAIALAQGYRPQNVQLMRNLVNLCYQSLRPTNELIDAANNCSLAPLDLGDGPAGTRVTGHSVTAYERYRSPRRLHSLQAIRAANNVLQTADPSAVNAAGPGANVGQGVVLNYAAEIVWSAWKATGDPKYFRALEDKARAVLAMKPKFTDDLCHRVELLTRYFPQDYVQTAAAVAEQERTQSGPMSRVPYKSHSTTPEEADALALQMEQQVAEDLARIRAIQNADGSWGFDPGRAADGGTGWKPAEKNPGEPSPTSLALIALQSAGAPLDDPAVARGVQALLAQQKPSGLWKGSSLTGFVSTAYAISALSRLYPADDPEPIDVDRELPGDESLLETIHRVHRLSRVEDPAAIPQLLQAAEHASPLVRYWALIGLGGVPHDDGVPTLIRGLGARAKLEREAAHWGLRQALIDDRGWEPTLEAARSGDDLTREAAFRALVMRVDGVLPGIGVDWDALTDLLATGMNRDPSPAVRAWALRAAWNWWYWNPPVRAAINRAWSELLTREEPEALVENAIRYQSHALFVVNGHHANPSNTHQYTELVDLFGSLHEVLQGDQDAAARQRLARRLVGIAATFYNAAGGDGGAGQMGYPTPGADDLFGDAFMDYFAMLPEDGPLGEGELLALQVALEGAAHIQHEKLQQELIHYSVDGPEKLRTIAAASVSDPRSAQLVAVPEMIEPLVRQIERGAHEPGRRAELSDPIIKLFSRVRWMVPANEAQQREILEYLIPDLDTYYSPSELQALDVAEREAAQRTADANWYLASELGDALGKNPDLHFPTVLEFFPEQAANPLQARFWLPSVLWILSDGQPLPEIDGEPAPWDDPRAVYRDRALRLYLAQLTADAVPETRELAVSLAQATELRSRPEVLVALEGLVSVVDDPFLERMVNNIRTQQELVTSLAAAAGREEPLRFSRGADGELVLPEAFVRDFRYFRDFVMPEMNRPLRADERSCFSCHGVPGRVPSLTLKPPNRSGYLSTTNVLANYRLLQERIDFDNPERSKLLRKPLNIQTGEEDGHQGGLRYRASDRGYLLLRKWVLHQVEHADQTGTQPPATGGGD